MDLKQLWQVAWKRRILVLGVFMLAFGVIAVYTFTRAPVYEASTKVLLENRDRTLTAMGQGAAENEAFSSVSRAQNPLDTQIELLKNAVILDRVIARCALKNPETGEPLTARQFMRLGSVTHIKGTDVLSLSYEHARPEVAREVADAWAAVFVEETKDTSQRAAKQAVAFLSGQLEKTRGELQSAETALRDFKRANTAVDLSAEARASVQTMTDLGAQLRAVTIAYQEARARAQALRGKVGLSGSEALASSALSQDPTVQTLRAQLLEAETQLGSASLGAAHPEAKQQQARVALLRKKLEEQSLALLGKQYQGNTTLAGLDPVRQGLARELIQAEIDAQGHQRRLETLRGLTTSFNGRLAGLPEKEYQLTRLERQAAIAAETFRLLTAKHEEARLQAAMTLETVQVVQPAALPDRPVRPDRGLGLLIGLVAGAGLGIGALLLMEYLDDTIQTTDAAERAVPLPTLGIIPWTQRNASLIAQRSPKSIAAEAYRTLRTNLKFLGAGQATALTVTSAGPGEGKSTVLANLAVVFAQTGKRVLIVDSDMRKPVMHERFGVANQTGLSALLAGRVGFDQAVRRGVAENLDLLTAGPLPEDPAELLESDRLDALITELRQRYDLVLFDAPPVIAVTDATVVASKVDGLMLVLGINRVSQKAARHALKLLNAAKVRLWGSVAHGMRPDNDPYYASYYHRYYGSLETKRSRKAS